MKPEMKMSGQEASAADYAQLMQALLASQAATPTARACADGEAKLPPQTVLDTLLGTDGFVAEQGERAVYPRTSAFLETDKTNASAAGQPSAGAAGRTE